MKLMTLHASKGLEFSHVFIIGVNYGLIPLRTKGMEEEEEERRLFFVGITRAKDQLELSYYINPGYNRVEPEASSYIRMIPGHLIEDEGGKDEGPVNLQEMKRQIVEMRGRKGSERAGTEPEIEPKVSYDNTETLIPDIQVKHRKYGLGTVIREDDMMVEVEFEGYGIKEFMKCFSELEYL